MEEDSRVAVRRLVEAEQISLCGKGALRQISGWRREGGQGIELLRIQRCRSGTTMLHGDGAVGMCRAHVGSFATRLPVLRGETNQLLEVHRAFGD